MKRMPPKSKKSVNSVRGPAPGVTAQNVGDFMLFAARNSEQVLSALVEALTDPIPPTWLPPIPKISSRALMSTIRVAESCGTPGTPDHKIWVRTRACLWNLLRINLLWNSPPLLPADIRVAKRVMRLVETLLGVEVAVLDPELRRLESDSPIKKLRQALTESNVDQETKIAIKKEIESLQGVGGTRRPQRGRHISERNQRRLTAVVLLTHCGNGKARSRQRVAEALYAHGVTEEADSLRKLEQDYKKAHKGSRSDAYLSPQDLPVFWLERLGWLLMDRRIQGNPPEFCAALLSQRLGSEWRKILERFQQFKNRDRCLDVR
jgi:hypothetical protein